MTFYSTASSDFITSRLDPRLINKLYNPLHNLSAVLGDTNGRWNLSTTNYILKDLVVTDDGLLFMSIITPDEQIQDRGTKFLRHRSSEFLLMSPDVLLSSQGRFTDFDSTMTIGEAEAPLRLDIEVSSQYGEDSGVEFLNKLTKQGLKAFRALSDKDESLVDSTEFGEITNPILVRSRKILPEHDDMTLSVKLILIEMLALFVTMSAVNKDYGVNVYTLTELNLITNNINSLIYQLETNEIEGWERYELIEILRDAFKAVKSISINKNLFKETYATRYNSIYSGGGVR